MGLVGFGSGAERVLQPTQGARASSACSSRSARTRRDGAAAASIPLARRSAGSPALPGSARSWRRLRLPWAARLAAPLLQLAGRHEVVAVEIRDPREQGSSPWAPCGSSTPRPGRELQVNTNDAKLRERFAVAAQRERQEVARELASAGVAHVTLSTDRDWLRDLAVFVKRRRR